MGRVLCLQIKITVLPKTTTSTSRMCCSFFVSSPYFKNDNDSILAHLQVEVIVKSYAIS